MSKTPEFQDLSRFKVPPGFRGRSGVVVLAWQLVQATLFGLSPQPCYAWRRGLLRLFGAKVGKCVVVRQTARITYPWKVEVGDHAWIGDHVELYSLDRIKIGQNAVISQRTYLCTGSHDIKDIAFSYRTACIDVEDEAWIAADCFVAPGVRIGRAAIVGARSSVFSDIDPAMIAYGSPARVRGARPLAFSRSEVSADIAPEPNIFFVGQFPPPVNGLTYVTSEICTFLKNARRIVAEADISGTSAWGRLGFHVSRLIKTLRACYLLIRLRREGRVQCVYITADGGLGLIYTNMLAGAARLLRIRACIHHHSFSYIDRRKILMRCLLVVSGPAKHIFLSDYMAKAFQGAYSKQVAKLILSNAAFVNLREVPREENATRSLRIGLLSNLTREKGLHCFLEIIERAIARGLPIEGLLAGHMPAPSDRELVENAVKELPIRYMGPVYADAKAAFYAGIDLFVFPTTYPNEAQPTVIFEALASGVPVIATDKGTIATQVGKAGVIVQHESTDLAETMLEAIIPFAQNPGLMKAMREAAKDTFASQREASNRALQNLC